MTEQRQLNPDVPADALEILMLVINRVPQTAAPENGMPGYRMTDRALTTINAAIQPKTDQKKK